MTNQQLTLVKRTWKPLRDVDPAVLGDVFYSRLFIRRPQLRSLFRGSMESQYERFVKMLSLIVARLDRPDILTDEISQLARRHEAYGVKPEHYADVRDALMWTLERGLGTDWNDDVAGAWGACYDLLTRSMLETV